MRDYISVSDLNFIAAEVIRCCEPLNELIVCGEISTFNRNYKSGHIYFSLKDEQSSVKAVMFRQNARLLGFDPQPGMRVLAYGHAALYERDGAFQLYVDFMRPFGVGAAQMAFDALKQKLEAEGLLAPERKKALPAVPNCIGIVTSKTGAALQDVRNVLQRRWPMVRLRLAPVSVQGLEAEQDIVRGIRALDADPQVDVLLVTRGGGSKEDLWAFNSERIARAAAACRKPLVSAVGHEIDYTILDYVADLRAPTPSAAAELLVPDQQELREKIFILGKNIQKNIQIRTQVWYNAMRACSPEQMEQICSQKAARARQQLAGLQDAVTRAAHAKLANGEAALAQQAAVAVSLNPYAVLSRGYCIARTDKGDSLRIAQLHPGQTICLEDAGASADCTVNTVTEWNKAGISDENTENAQNL